MKEQKSNHTKWLHLRLKPEDEAKIKEHFKDSSCRKISDYARRVLLQKPVTIKTRNESQDKLTEEILKVRKELNAIGHNFNQTVKKFNALSDSEELKTFILIYRNEEKVLTDKLDFIKGKLNQIVDKWLQ